MSIDKHKKCDLSALPGQVDDDVAARLQGGARGVLDQKSEVDAIGMQDLNPGGEPARSHQSGEAGKDSGGISLGSDLRISSKLSLDDGDHARSDRANSSGSLDPGLSANGSILARHDSAGDAQPGGSEVKARAATMSERPAQHDDPGDIADAKPRSQSAPGTAALMVEAKDVAKNAGDPPAQTLSGDIKNEIGKLPSTFLKQAAAGAMVIQAALNQEAAKAAGTYSSAGSLDIGDDVLPKTVKSENGSTQKEVTDGTYGAGYAGALAYKGDLGVGVVVAAGYEGGWTSRTVVKEDRFGAQVVVTESWADATFAVGARGEADANASGAQIKVQLKAEVGADKGIRVSVTDVETGITYTKSGHLAASASATAEGKALVTWERVSLSLEAKAGAAPPPRARCPRSSSPEPAMALPPG